MTVSKMDMEPVEIVVALIRAGVVQAALARKLGVTDQAVSQVIRGASTSHKIRRAISDAINIDIRQIWPSTYIIHGGPRRPGRPKAA